MKFLIIFAVFICAVSCQITTPADYSHPDHPGKCVYQGTPLTLGSHDNVASTSCFRFNCLENGFGTMEICPLTGYPPNCRIEEDLTKPYPACCDKKPTCT